MNNKKKVLIIAYDGMGKSGVPGVIMEIINGLHDKYDFTIAVFSSIEGDYYFQRIKELGIEIIVIPKQSNTNKIGRFYREYIGYHNYLYRCFNDIFKTKQYDAVHSFKEGDSSGIFKAARKNKIDRRILHTTVLHNNNSGLVGLLQRHKLKLTNKYASQRVGVSKLSCELAFKGNEYTVIHNSYNSDIYKYKDTGPFHRLEMVQVGYFCNNKNQLFSLELCKKLQVAFPDVLLHFFGYSNEKDYYEKMLKYINEQDLSNNVIIHSYDEEQTEVFNNCSFALTPSLREGFSITILEAQACGIRCIASTGVPDDANAGGVEYLELNVDLWSSLIVNEFTTNKGKHKKYDLGEYSSHNFVRNIDKLYR